LQYEKVNSEEKLIKLEHKIKEMEMLHQKEMKFMQQEISKIKEDDHYRTIFNKALTGEHLTTNTNRKIQQNNISAHHKAMSISSHSVNQNIIMPGAHTTKKTSGARKINNDFQKNLMKRFVAKNESDLGNLELSTRTPDKTNPELSPYVMDFHKMKRSLYKENIAKKRTAGNHLKFKQSVKEYYNNAVKEEPGMSRHKKSKSQTAILGVKMDRQSSQHEPNDESTYTTHIKVNTKRDVKQRKKSIQNDKNTIKVDIGVSYQGNNRAKCHSKKKTASKIFWTKDSTDFASGEIHQTNTFRELDRDENARRSASSIGFYMTDRREINPPTKNNYNRYIANKFSSASNSKTNLKIVKSNGVSNNA